MGWNPVEVLKFFFGLKLAIAQVAITTAIITFTLHLYSPVQINLFSQMQSVYIPRRASPFPGMINLYIWKKTSWVFPQMNLVSQCLKSFSSSPPGYCSFSCFVGRALRCKFLVRVAFCLLVLKFFFRLRDFSLLNFSRIRNWYYSMSSQSVLQVFTRHMQSFYVLGD